MVTVSELFMARQFDLPHDTLIRSFTSPSVAITTAVGSADCSWKAVMNRSVITCVVAEQPHPGVTMVIVAIMGTNTVVPFSTGVSYVYVTVASGWLVEGIGDFSPCVGGRGFGGVYG